MTERKLLFSFPKPEVKAVANTKTFDYQGGLLTLWLDHVKADLSGVLEKSVNHGDGCKCCTHILGEFGRGRNAKGPRQATALAGHKVRE